LQSNNFLELEIHIAKDNLYSFLTRFIFSEKIYTKPWHKDIKLFGVDMFDFLSLANNLES